MVQKGQSDKLKVCFPFDILGGPLCAAESVKNLGVCPNMFRTSAKVVLYNSMTLDMSESFLLYILLSMLLSQNKGINSPIESIKTWVCGLILICSLKHIFFKHIQRVCKNCLMQHRDFSFSKFSLCKLQCIQNNAARILGSPI